MRPMLTAALAGLMLAAVPLAAQTVPAIGVEQALTAADLEIIRTELRADKRTKTAETLALSDAEAARFWPVYDKYIAELAVINDGKVPVGIEESISYQPKSKSEGDF